MLCSSVILKKYKKIQKLNKREKEVMFLLFLSLPCISWLFSSLVVSSDDFPAQLGAAPSLPFLGGARRCRAAGRAGAPGLGLRVTPSRLGPGVQRRLVKGAGWLKIGVNRGCRE